MKTISIISFAILIIITGCNSKLSENELKAEMNEYTIKYNHLVVSGYLGIIEQTGEIPRLGYLDWKHVQTYWDSIPDLKKLRDDFEDASDVWINFKIEHDEDYKHASNLFDNNKITQKEFFFRTSETDKKLFKKYPKEYRKVKGYQANKLGVSNRITLKYMIEDYDSKGKLFPIKWIPESYIMEIKKDSIIQNICNKLSDIEKELDEYK
uniref:hypothetical protein n=1 Tax=uncultured Draconibacterium sp. TaxID=1573823 RepID=UPI003217471F